MTEREAAAIDTSVSLFEAKSASRTVVVAIGLFVLLDFGCALVMTALFHGDRPLTIEPAYLLFAGPLLTLLILPGVLSPLLGALDAKLTGRLVVRAPRDGSDCCVELDGATERVARLIDIGESPLLVLQSQREGEASRVVLLPATTLAKVVRNSVEVAASGTCRFPVNRVGRKSRELVRGSLWIPIGVVLALAVLPEIGWLGIVWYPLALVLACAVARRVPDFTLAIHENAVMCGDFTVSFDDPALEATLLRGDTRAMGRFGTLVLRYGNGEELRVWPAKDFGGGVSQLEIIERTIAAAISAYRSRAREGYR